MTFPQSISPLLAFLLFGSRCLAAEPEETPPINRLAVIRSLSRPEAAKAHPVHLRGVISLVTKPSGSLIIDDGEQSIWVDTKGALKRGFLPAGSVSIERLQPGTLLELEGVTDSGGYAPVVVPKQLHILGSGTPREARPVAIERLLSGDEDGQRVTVEGVVQEVFAPNKEGVVILYLITDGHPCEVSFQHERGLNAAALVDARVRVRGAFTPLPNLRAEMARLRISAMGKEDLDVLVAPPRDPFLAPRVPLHELLPFSPEAVPFHRKVTRGIVTLAVPGRFFFIQDGLSGVRVRSSSAKVKVGQQVDVAGFVNTEGTLASLTGATVRVLGPGPVPAAAAADAWQVLHPVFLPTWHKITEEDFSSRLIRIRGRLRCIDKEQAGTTVSLQLESRGEMFSAILPLSPLQKAPQGWPWTEGTDLELTGVCELDFKGDGSLRDPVSIAGFHLWVRSAGDVVVLRVPSWWTSRRLSLALFGVGSTLLFVVGWNLFLRRILRRRTRNFEEVMQTHRNVELEFKSAQRERMRLAVDLHDGLKQLLATASFRLDAAARHLPDSAGSAAENLRAAHLALGRTQTELQDCLWGLHAVEEGPPELSQLFQHVTASQQDWAPKTTTIRREELPRRLSRNLDGSLLLLFQEAVGNAFRHGNATRVTVTVSYGEDALDLRIVDDGTGFDPATALGVREGHFGIEGMKKRMLWLRGTLEITRHEGGGMEIRARLPWSAMPKEEEEAALQIP